MIDRPVACSKSSRICFVSLTASGEQLRKIRVSSAYWRLEHRAGSVRHQRVLDTAGNGGVL